MENYRAHQFSSVPAYIQFEEARTLANVSSAQNLQTLQHARLAEATDTRRYMSGSEADPLFQNWHSFLLRHRGSIAEQAMSKNGSKELQ